ncbi:MAG: twin-arginine translocation signal domain-containing protein, partial [Planctomycetaceae bacterium]
MGISSRISRRGFVRTAAAAGSAAILSRNPGHAAGYRSP